MLAHHKLFATTPGRKSTRPSVGQIGPSAALRRLPDALHRAARRALPKEPICTHQIDSYLPKTALRADAVSALRMADLSVGETMRYNRAQINFTRRRWRRRRNGSD